MAYVRDDTGPETEWDYSARMGRANLPGTIISTSSVLFSVLFCSCGATMEAVAGMLLHSTALRPVSCTGPMRIPGVCV